MSTAASFFIVAGSPSGFQSHCWIPAIRIGLARCGIINSQVGQARLAVGMSGWGIAGTEQWVVLASEREGINGSHPHD